MMSDITERQYFAAHAPDVPGWYRELWAEMHKGNQDFVIHFFAHDQGGFGGYKITSASGSSEFNITVPTGMMKLIKDWRYAYADMMLEDKQ